MKFSFEIGETEKTTVHFNFNQLLGTVTIGVGDQPIIRSTRVFNEPVREVFQFVIHGQEKTAVRIEQRRKPLFGHHDTVFVNNRLTKVFDSFF